MGTIRLSLSLVGGRRTRSSLLGVLRQSQMGLISLLLLLSLAAPCITQHSNTIVTLNTSVRHTLPATFVSFTVDAGQLFPGVFWNHSAAIDFDAPALRNFAASLAPAFLRVSGTDALSYHWYPLEGIRTARAIDPYYATPKRATSLRTLDRGAAVAARVATAAANHGVSVWTGESALALASTDGNSHETVLDENVTVMLLNVANTTNTVSLQMGQRGYNNEQARRQLQAYVLSPFQDGDGLETQKTLLNGHELIATHAGVLPHLLPVLVSSDAVELAPFSVAFLIT